MALHQGPFGTRVRAIGPIDEAAPSSIGALRRSFRRGG
jgi:hypothetical protein